MLIFIDTLIFARWIIPIEPHHQIMEHYAIAIHEGKIVDLLPQSTAKTQYAASQTYELPHHALMPGLINTHTHSPMTLLRGLGDDMPLMQWLNDYIWPTEGKWMNEEFCYNGTLIAIAEMLRSGTTCFNEHYFFPEAIAKATDQTGMRARISATIIDFPTPWSKTHEEGLSKARNFIEQYKNNSLIKLGIAPHAPYTLSDTSLLKIKQLANEFNLPIHIHTHETADEITGSLKEYNKRPLKRLFDIGFLESHVQHVHLTQINDEDIKILQQTKGHATHCPESNLKLASGFCPVQKLLNAGINVALGTDGAASNNDLDMFAEMQTAAMLAKSVAQDPTAVDAATALRIATLNGAKAMGLEKEIGSLEIGKAADVIAIDLQAANTQPVYHPISHLVYAVNSRQVSDVWVAGKQLLKNHNLTTIDENNIYQLADKWRKRISS